MRALAFAPSLHAQPVKHPTTTQLALKMLGAFWPWRPPTGRAGLASRGVCRYHSVYPRYIRFPGECQCRLIRLSVGARVFIFTTGVYIILQFGASVFCGGTEWTFTNRHFCVQFILGGKFSTVCSPNTLCPFWLGSRCSSLCEFLSCNFSVHSAMARCLCLFQPLQQEKFFPFPGSLIDALV